MNKTLSRRTKGNILVVSFSMLSSDPRVRRHLLSLVTHFKCFAGGYSDPVIPGIDFIPIASNPSKTTLQKVLHAAFSILGLHELNYFLRSDVQALIKHLKVSRYDLIIANDIETLPAVVKYCHQARILFDAHEFSPKEFSESWRWRFLYGRAKSFLCRKYLPKANAIMTVNQGILREYTSTFGVHGEVIYNTPAYSKLPVRSPGNTIRIIHHGAALRSRRLELMIEVMRRLPNRYQLDFMLMPSDQTYYAELKHMAAAVPNIRFIPTVPTEQIVTTIAKYDIGLYMLYPSNFNNLMALPNKFFEFVQARLAIFVGPSPEMAAILKTFGNGVVIGDFEPESMAKAIQQYSRNEIFEMKKNSAKAARIYCLENEQKKLRAIVERLLQSGARET